MRNVLNFIDGAVFAALWTSGPLLLPSLLHLGNHRDATSAVVTDAGGGSTATAIDTDSIIGQRPLSAEDALLLTGTLSNALSNSSSSDSISSTTTSSTMSEEEHMEMWQSLPGSMVSLLLAYLLGRVTGGYVMSKSYLINARCPTRIRNVSSSRVVCLMSSTLVSMIMLNWGLGMATYWGWVTIRFITAFISGGLKKFTDRMEQQSKGHSGDDGLSEQQRMEEGQQLLSLSSSDEEKKMNISLSSSSMNTYWLMGVAASALLSGFVFYPFNRLELAFSPHERFYVFILFVGTTGLVDRYLMRYFTSRRVSKPARTSSTSPFNDAGIVVSGRRNSTTPTSRGSSFSNRPSTIQRRKQHATRQPSLGDQEGQFVASSPPQRSRLNSNSSVESEQFFDCLDDIELGFEESDAKQFPVPINHQSALKPHSQNYDNQIATYTSRKVVYSDGSPSYVPAGESIAIIPPGYLELYKHNRTKAQSKYNSTQQWRRTEHIHRIHTKPHLWYQKIKVAYPHVIHGFTPNGMPVVYESPGQMNLKQLFRSGCHVEDMVFHYCYLMEYLSNLESILTELHSELSDECGDEWQEQLAAYAHAKQTRLQNDAVPFGFCVVMDVSGASPTSLSGDVMTYLSRAGEINSLHYPGSMRRATAVQAPFWLGAAWGAIKNVMPASVTVDLLSASQTMKGGLNKYIDEDQIPAEYGGKSQFKLGEHPFEVGLRKLVERQNDVDEEESVGNDFVDTAVDIKIPDTQDTQTTPLHDATPSPHINHLVVEQGSDLKLSSPGARSELSTGTFDWDDLGSDYVLIVATILYFLLHSMLGAIELTLPLWAIVPSIQGGLGYEAHSTGMMISFTCASIFLFKTKTRMCHLASSIAETSPLRGFRIGMGSMGFFWLCLSLVLYISPPNKSTMGLLSLIFYFTILYYACSVGLISVEHLRSIGTSSFAEGSDTLPWLFTLIGSDDSTPKLCILGRSIGYVVAAPIFRWSIRLPLNASCLLLASCSSWFLYTVSFSLHTVAPSPVLNRKSRRKESQFVTAMMGWISFIKELFVVACGDVSFLLKEMARGGVGGSSGGSKTV